MRCQPIRTTSALSLLILFAAALPLLASQSPLPSQQQSPGASSSAITSDEGVRGKKLILKDGSFQIVREYKIEGDRVKFYSVERSEWEEIPASLVDWPATRKAANWPDATEKRALALAHRVDLEAHPGSLDVDAGTGLPPGILLPPGDGMYSYNGKAIQLLKATVAESKLDKGRFVAKLIVPVPVVPTRYTISIKGKHAATRIDNSEPVFFYRTENGTPQMRLIRTKPHGKEREIEFLSSYFGQQKTDANEVPLNLQQVNNDTYRLMAAQDLAPGEYVLAQLLPDRGLDLYVWDFGVDLPSPKTPSKK